MFIYSVRGSTVRMVGLLLLLAAIIGVIAFSGEAGVVSAASSATEIDYSGIKDKEDRVGFIKNFGIDIDEGSEQSVAFRMPDNFDRVIAGYNELQKRQGLDLLKYKNKKVTRYTYKVTNYDIDGDVYANLFVYRGKIVACDLSCTDNGGFVIPLTRVDRSNLK